MKKCPVCNRKFTETIILRRKSLQCIIERQKTDFSSEKTKKFYRIGNKIYFQCGFLFYL